MSSDAAAARKRCAEDGVRCDMAEHCLEETSPGLPWADALRRSAAGLERCGCVRAMTTLSVVSGGPAVVQHGTRRLGDPQWFRGARDVQRGWQGVQDALTRCDARSTTVSCRSAPDPEPAMASKQPEAKRRQLRFVLASQEAA